MADYSVSLEAFPYASIGEEEQHQVELADGLPVAIGEEEQQEAEVLSFTSGLDDSTPPTVTVEAPTPGAELARNGTVTFTVTDNLGLRDVVVWVSVSGAWEVVYGGASYGFAPAYDGSTKAPISSGFRFVVTRAGGWRASPTFVAQAFDVGGNQS